MSTTMNKPRISDTNGNHISVDTEDDISDRNLMLFRAQICEQSGRYEDMVTVMNELCKTYDDLLVEERNLLSCAYKNVIGSRRTSWRVLNEYLQNQSEIHSNNTSPVVKITKPQDDDDHSTATSQPSVIIIKSFLKTIESEIDEHCSNIIDILTNRLISSASSTGESRVFYYKMKGDYTRYLCEVSSATEKKEKSNESLMAYKTASDKAMIELPPTHPVRLGLMLNFSVFYYDIMKSPERSCRLAKQAFDDAIAELDTLSEESYRDSTIIMQLLRDNLNLWESEQNVQQINNNSNNGNNFELDT